MKKKPMKIHPRAAREKMGLSLSKLAEISGVSRSSICRAERFGRWSRFAAIAAAHKKALGIA